MSKEFRLSIENILTSHDLSFEFDSTINPSAQVVHIQPRGLKLIVLSSTLEDNSLEKVVETLSAQSKYWWQQDSEVTLNARLELKGA